LAIRPRMRFCVYGHERETSARVATSSNEIAATCSRPTHCCTGKRRSTTLCLDRYHAGAQNVTQQRSRTNG